MAVTVTYFLDAIRAQFRANDQQTDFSQKTSNVITYADGGFTVVFGNENGDEDFVFGERFATQQAASSSLVVPEIGASDLRSEPVIARLANGHTTLVWQEGPNANGGIRATVIDAAGFTVGTPDFSLDGAAGVSDPEVAALSDGRWAVAFVDGSGGITVQLRTGAEALAGSVITAEAGPGRSQPAIAGLTTGGFVVASVDAGNIVTHLFDVDGETVEHLQEVSGGTNGSPKVTGLENGGYALVYQDSDIDGTPGIGLKLFSASGSPGATVRVDTGTLSRADSQPEITVLENGFIIVTWTEDFSATDQDIKARIFDASGTPITVGGSTVLNLDSTFEDETESSVAAFLAGRFITTWTDTVGDGDGNRISARIDELVRVSTGDAASDALSGDALRDTIRGGDGNDVLDGERGSDELFGDDGDDTLIGGLGDDTLHGGAGLDLAVFSSATGDVTLVLDDDGNGAMDAATDGVGLDTVTGIENLDGGRGNDTFIGNIHDNAFFGEDGNDDLDGGVDGVDSLTGGDGNDTLQASGGNDTFVGGDGDDTYIVEQGDFIGEANTAAGGSDLVFARGSFALASGVAVERLQFANPGFGTRLSGNEFAQTLVSNFLDNRLAGGRGNDTYLVDTDSEDVIVEGAVGGTNDRVLVRSGGNLDYTLNAGAFVEVLATEHAAGTDAIGITGNEIGQSITGNAGDNLLNGGGGNDVLSGGRGDDGVFADEGDDTASGGDGNDFVDGGEGNDIIDGGAGDDQMDGQSGNDVIDGGTGADNMLGFEGDDVFIVDNRGDRINVEGVGEGNDTVRAKISYALNADSNATAMIEQLETFDPASTQALNLTGNRFDQTISGNKGANVLSGLGGDDLLTGVAGSDTLLGGAGNDVLNGGQGTDVLRGGPGNDTYFADAAAEAIEAANGGTDTVRSTVTYTLGANLENLVLTGAAASDGTGNSQANTISGNAGQNIIDGQAGNDRLSGGVGPDTFVFSTTLNARTNVDVINGFNVADDTLRIDNAVFAGLANGALAPDAFHTGPTAADAEDRLIYRAATGALFFDADGAGGATQIQFATVTANLAMTHADFFVI